MCATLCAPIVFRRFPRRFVYTVGALLLVAAGAFFATHTLAGQAAGQFLRILGCEHARDHAEPLHHGIHSEAGAGAQRVAAGSRSARSPGPLGRPSASGSTSATASSRPISGARAWALILIALFWWLAPLRQHRDPAGQASAGQSDRQHPTLHRAASPPSRLARSPSAAPATG